MFFMDFKTNTCPTCNIIIYSECTVLSYWGAHRSVCVRYCFTSYSGLHSRLQCVCALYFTPYSVFFSQCFMTHCKYCVTFPYLSRNTKSWNSSGLESEFWMLHRRTSQHSVTLLVKSYVDVFLLLPIEIQSVIFLILNLDLIVLSCVKILRLNKQFEKKDKRYWD